MLANISCLCEFSKATTNKGNFHGMETGGILTTELT